MYVKHIESYRDKFYVVDKKMKKALPYVQHPDLPVSIQPLYFHGLFSILKLNTVNKLYVTLSYV